MGSRNLSGSVVFGLNSCDRNSAYGPMNLSAPNVARLSRSCQEQVQYPSSRRAPTDTDGIKIEYLLRGFDHMITAAIPRNTSGQDSATPVQMLY